MVHPDCNVFCHYCVFSLSARTFEKTTWTCALEKSLMQLSKRFAESKLVSSYENSWHLIAFVDFFVEGVREENSWYYSTFTYFGSSNFFWFLLHNENFVEKLFCAINVRYTYFLKMCLVWEYGECNKSYECESKKMSHESFVHFSLWNGRMTCRRNHCRFLPLPSQE